MKLQPALAAKEQTVRVKTLTTADETSTISTKKKKSRKMTLFDHFIRYYNAITPVQGGIILSIIFLYIFHLFLRDLDVPPGPRGLPVIGYWPFLKTDTSHIQLKELTKKYGDIFSLRVTGKLFIHISSFKVLKEAHLTKADCFEERFTDYSVLVDTFKEGLLFINGEQWKVLRRFFLQKFKEYGMNAIKENTSCSVYDSLRDLVEELQNLKGRSFKVMDLTASKTSTALRRIIFNDGGITDEELKKSYDLYAIVSHALTSKNFLLMGNFARYFILPLLPTYWSAKRSNQRIEDIFTKVVERQKAEYDEKRITNLIDAYFKERDDRKKRGDSTAAYFTDIALVGSLSQFVTDGILTVGILVSVILSTLVEHPEEQEKVYQEIMDVIGSARLPTMDDKTNLPYTNAFIYEVMRFSDFFPLYPSLECTKETTLNGYKIPKGAITLLNLYAIHRNPENYKNPDVFNPSRYLEKPRPELPALFGIGKRNCIGEAFSMIEVFLLVTTVVQNFRLTYPEGSKDSKNMFWSSERVDIRAFPRSHN